MATRYDPRVLTRDGRPAVRPEFVIDAAERVLAGQRLSPALVAKIEENVERLRAEIPDESKPPTQRSRAKTG